MKTPILCGMTASEVTIESTVSGSGVVISGIPDLEATEMALRVTACLKVSGVNFSGLEVTISGAPEHARTAGLDLAVFVSILDALGLVINRNDLKNKVFLASLGYSGSVESVPGLTILLSQPGPDPVVAFSRSAEAAASGRNHVFAVQHIHEVVLALTLQDVMPEAIPEPVYCKKTVILEEVCTSFALQGLKEAVENKNSLLILGPLDPERNTMISRIPFLFKKLSPEEIYDITAVRSVASMLPPGVATVSEVPFRAPHFSVSSAGLCGTKNRPGEIALAKHGVLFLDGISEFRQEVISNLFRSDLSGVMIVATASLCPCGKNEGCRCSDKFKKAMSDRIDKIRCSFDSVIQGKSEEILLFKY